MQLETCTASIANGRKKYDPMWHQHCQFTPANPFNLGGTIQTQRTRFSTQHFHILTFFWQSSHLGNCRNCPLSWSITEWIEHTVYWHSEALLLWKRSMEGLWPNEKSRTIASIFPMKPFFSKSNSSICKLHWSPDTT